MTDLNTLFAHTRFDILEMIDTAIENGIIYNVDYKDLKDAVNRKLEEGYRAAVVKPYLEGLHHRNEEISPEMSEILYYNGKPQAHTLNARDKGITKLEKTEGDHWMVKTAREYLELVRPVIENLVIIKGLVVKGRKPSTDPRKTPERTLENTGTCSVCGRNVKLNSFGKIVDHGYTIRYGFQEGNCFGVGYDPIEISHKGTVAYINALGTFRDAQEKALPKAVEAAEALALKQKGFEDSREERAVRNAPHNIESQIRHLGLDIKAFAKIVAEWEAKPLPAAA
jgi:hypothetical protein